MDIDTFRGIVTALLLVLFTGLAIWAWSRNRDDVYQAAARMPLADDKPPEVADREETE